MSSILGMDPLSFVLAVGSLTGFLFSAYAACYALSSPFSQRWVVASRSARSVRTSFNLMALHLPYYNRKSMSKVLDSMEQELDWCKPFALVIADDPFMQSFGTTSTFMEWRKRWCLFWLAWRLEKLDASYKISSQPFAHMQPFLLWDSNEKSALPDLPGLKEMQGIGEGYHQGQTCERGPLPLPPPSYSLPKRKSSYSSVYA